MRAILLGCLVSLGTSVCLANSFDAFVGDYRVSSVPLIKSMNAKFCNRFDFKEIVELKVVVDTHGYMQSHMIYLMAPQGSSGQPTMDFSYTNDWGSGGSYAKTTGSAGVASNEFGTWGSNPDEKQTLIMTMTSTGGGYSFAMSENFYQNNQLSASCSYLVSLNKK